MFPYSKTGRGFPVEGNSVTKSSLFFQFPIEEYRYFNFLSDWIQRVERRGTLYLRGE